MLHLVFLFVVALTLAGCGGGSDDSPDAMPPDQAGDATFSDGVEGRSMVFTPAEGRPSCVRFTGEWRFESWDDGSADYPAGWYEGDFADVSDRDDVDTISFTWDPDNDPDEAELVADLTFTSDTTGTYASIYSEGDDESPTVEGDFEIVEGHLDGADCRREDTRSDPGDTKTPDETDEPTFSDLVEGQSMVFTRTEGGPFCVRFIGAWRFESYDHDLSNWYAGDYADVSPDGGTSGTLSFTWDPDNDPDEYELVADLTFESERTGTYRYVYSAGDEAFPAVQGDFEIVGGRLDAADCRG